MRSRPWCRRAKARRALAEVCFFRTCSKGQACRFAHEEVSRPRSQFACDECDHCFNSEVALAQHWQNRHQRPQVQAAAKGSGKAAFAAPTPGVPQRNTPSGGAYVVEECETEAVDPAGGLVARGVEAEGGDLVALTRRPRFTRLDEIGNIGRRRRPPLGRIHKMDVKIGKVRARMVKDTGASATTIPERVALRVIHAHLDLDPATENYPVGEIFEYDPPVRLTGFAASRITEIRFGCVLLVTFETVPVEFRVVPDEMDSSEYPLLGASTIGPEGLDVRTTLAHHVVARLNLRCARAELDTGRAGQAPGGAGQWVAEENLLVTRCVGDEVFVPEGELAAVTVSRPPAWMEGPLWVGPVPGRVLAGEEGLGQLGLGVDEGLTVLEGPVGLPGPPLEDDAVGEPMVVFVRAPEERPVPISPGAAVCVVGPADDLEAELAAETEDAVGEAAAEEIR